MTNSSPADAVRRVVDPVKDFPYAEDAGRLRAVWPSVAHRMGQCPNQGHPGMVSPAGVGEPPRGAWDAPLPHSGLLVRDGHQDHEHAVLNTGMHHLRGGRRGQPDRSAE